MLPGKQTIKLAQVIAAAKLGATPDVDAMLKHKLAAENAESHWRELGPETRNFYQFGDGSVLIEVNGRIATK